MKRYFLLLNYVLLISISTMFARPLNILFYTSRFPYQTRQYIDNQIVGFIDAGVNVRILSSQSVLYENYALAEKYNFKGITFLQKLPENQKSYDIIYCQFAHFGKKALKMRKNGDIEGKIVACVRSGSEIRKIKANVEEWRSFFEEVDLILAVCKVFKDELILLGCPVEKIMVHHSAIDVNQFQYQFRKTINCDAVKLVTVGRLIQSKGHKYVIEAVSYLKKEYPNITYDIYGDGYLCKRLKDVIKDYDLSNNVFLKGYCDHDILQTVLNRYDIFVLTSFGRGICKEGIPNVLMEAMAMGFPVIGTWHSGIPELIDDNISGFLVPEQDSIALAKKIDYIIQHPEILESIGKAAQKKVVREHNREEQNKRILDIFRRLVNDENIF